MAHPTITDGSFTASKTSGTTINTPGMTMAVGDIALVVFACDPAAGSVTVADSGGKLGTFTVEQDLANGSGTSGVRIVVAWSFCTTAGTAQATVTHPSLAARIVRILKIAGADQTTPVVDSDSSTSAAPSMTPVAGDVLAISMVGLEGVGAAQVNTLTGQTGFTAETTTTATDGTSGGGGASNITTGFASWSKDPANTSNIVPSATVVTGTKVWAGLIFQAPVAASPKAALFDDRRNRRNSLLRR